MKICIVGNSHSACVFKALKLQIGFKNVVFDSFAVAGQIQPILRNNEDGLFYPVSKRNFRSTIGDFLNIHDFDAIYLCAFSFGAPLNRHMSRVGHILKDMQPEGWPNPHNIPEVSRQEFYATFKRRMNKTGIPSVLRRLGQQNYKGDIFTQLPPPISEEALSDREWVLQLRWGHRTEELMSDFLDTTYIIGREIIAETGVPTTVLPPPSESLSGSFLSTSYAHTDKTHGNIRYGVATLQSLRAQIGYPEITGPTFQQQPADAVHRSSSEG